MTKYGYIFIILSILLISACKTEWTKAIRSGSISQNQFTETVSIDVQKGLIFLPVSIKGKKYRFLFDTGAPFSISKKLQDEYAFKVVSKGNIIDSDLNRKKVNWAEVESITIGNLSFQRQTAFIGDFEANPILKCLGVDGIIGSNLIRHCNWTIDQDDKTLVFFKNICKYQLDKCTAIPFKTDFQYNMFVNIGLGHATIKNVLLDYGSSGSMALDDEIFTELKSQNIFDNTFTETGVQQSGIIGKAVTLNREIVFSDSVHIDENSLNKVMLSTGKTNSIGNNLLSRFRVTIDWSNQKLHLLQGTKPQDSIQLSGFKLGYSIDKGIYVQSVMENSDAYNKGVRPNMKVTKLDSLDFKNGNDFCDYIDHKLKDDIFLELINSQEKRTEYQIKMTFF